MVGSREAPQRWLEWTQEQAGRLGGAGVCVVSGGAFGVDAAAHEGAMQGGGQTVAVMPCGLRERAPRGNRALFERVEAQGALVSEYPPRVAVRKHHFARRNRLIAALSGASVVVRAGEGSGALYTAQAALSLGRPVGVVPFDVLDEGAAGGVALLAGGLALAVRGAEDMLTLCGGDASALRVEAAREVARGVSCGLDGVAGAVFGLLGAQALGAEEVARGLGAGMGEVLGALLELELGGWAVKEAGRAAWRRA
jgi:DNA processing protein